MAGVDTKHPDYARYAPEWARIDDCVAGERAVKAQKTKYLPHPGFDPSQDPMASKRYDSYLARAPFLNATGRTLQALLGVAFAKPVEVSLSGALDVLRENADGRGLPIAQVLRGALSAALKGGRFGFLVDFSRPAKYDAEGNPVPMTAEEAAGQRVLIDLYSAREVINWREENGRTTLVVTQRTVEVMPDDVDDFAMHSVTEYVELRLVEGVAHCRRWIHNTGATIGAYPSGFTKTDLVPLRDRDGSPLEALPWAWGGAFDNNASVDPAPLADLAGLNIKHFAAEADLAELAHVVGQPTLVVSGLTQTWVDKNLQNGIALGATRGLPLPQDSAASLLQAEDRNVCLTLCERREKQMAMIGAALIERGSAPKTATEADFDARTDNSALALAAGNVEAAFNKALEIAGRFVVGEGSVMLDRTYTALNIDPQAITALMAGVQTGVITLESFVRYLMRQGIEDDSRSVEDIMEALRVQNEPPTGGVNDEGQ
uniref:Phage structural protein n=1 Tax=Edwardsiella phage eiAU TaxID=945083 RepID=E7EKS2_9CAUD|nr:phage structural protein [Edwardsiella phage eiAU]